MILTKIKHLNLFTLIFIICSCSAPDKSNSTITTPEPSEGVTHSIIYYEEGRFAAWPANSGIWIWDNDEILVGFNEGEHLESAIGLHKIKWSSECSKYARSLDGGQTWSIEDAYDAGQSTMGRADQPKQPYTKLTSPLGDFQNPEFMMTFRRENNHNGRSHFYYSENKGKNWQGPYLFPDLGLPGIISRTDYSVEGPQTLGAFITVSKDSRTEGQVAFARTTDGAQTWELVTLIGEEPDGFDIMPSSIRLSPNELITSIRSRTKEKQDKITCYYSDDNGLTWEQLKDPVADTGKGGSPPALVQLNDGRLAVAYAYRSEYGSRLNIRFSNNNGISWGDEIMIRGGDGANRDVGYPEMVQRKDGKLVLVYYWNHVLDPNKPPYRYIACSIIDPHHWN